MEMESFHGELMDHILVSWKAIFFQLSLSPLSGTLKLLGLPNQELLHQLLLGHLEVSH